MGTSLNGLNPASTYQALIKVGNNTNLNTTLKTLSDGAGNDLPMQASTTGINFTGTVSGVASGVSGAIQFSNGSAFASDATNLFWDDTNNRLNIGQNTGSRTVNINDSLALYQSGTTQLQVAFHAESYGGRFASYTAQQFVIPNSYAGVYAPIMNIGSMSSTTNLGATLGIKGSGSTSATTSLLVQNSSATELLRVRDDGRVYIGTTGWFEPTAQSTSLYNFYSKAILTSTEASNVVKVLISNNQHSFLSANTANGQVGINTTTPNASAALDITSTTTGFLPPRMTTTQKNAISSPAEGLEMYDSTAKSPAYYDGTNWGYTGGALQNAAGNSGTLNISFAAGNIVNLTLNANTTLAFSNAVIGTYIIQVTQGATGANVLTYPASVKWAGGTAPTLTTTVGKTDILTFYYDGINYYGTYSLNY